MCDGDFGSACDFGSAQSPPIPLSHRHPEAERSRSFSHRSITRRLSGVEAEEPKPRNRNFLL